MSQYNLRTLPSQDYAAFHAGEDEEFHNSFKYPPINLAKDQGSLRLVIAMASHPLLALQPAMSMAMQMTSLR